jgi:mannitol-1-phosphate 5-dehydrogenase
MGQLFSGAGWEVVFLDVADAVVDALNARRAYRIEVKDDLLPGQRARIDVRNVSAVSLKNRAAAIDTLVRADMVGTSVGAANLESACALLTDALPARTAPLSVLLCENLHGAAGIARAYMEKHIPGGGALSGKISFVEAAISKMVPTLPPHVRAADPLVAWAEAYNTLYLDADAYIGGEPPAVPGVAWRSGFGAYVDRKLLLHNFGHAAAAYTGFLAGKTEIWQCMDDPRVREEVAGCMTEAARGLSLRHSRTFTFDENRAWMDDLLRRFGNRNLGDTVFRVGRDLRRKYAPGDRMLGTLRMLRDEKVEYTHTARAVAAGLLFAGVDENGNGFPGDADVVCMARDEGVEKTLAVVAGVDLCADADLVGAVAEEYGTLKNVC